MHVPARPDRFRLWFLTLSGLFVVASLGAFLWWLGFDPGCCFAWLFSLVGSPVGPL